MIFYMVLFKHFRMTSKVEPIKECNLCYEIYPIKSIANLKCWSYDNNHIICKDCFQKESQRRKSIGIQSPNECIICKPFQEKIETITITPSRNIRIIIENNNDSTRFENSATYTMKLVARILIMIIMYFGLNLNWHFYRMVGHFLDTGEYLDQPIEWSLINAFYALLLDAFIFLMIISITVKN